MFGIVDFILMLDLCKVAVLLDVVVIMMLVGFFIMLRNTED